MAKRRRRTSIAGLRWRDGIAYYERSHGRLKAGRVFKSLGIRGDEGLALTYASALNTLCERGDWAVVDRWARGEIHITDIARAVREGEYGALKRLTAQGTLLGEAVEKFLQRSAGSNSKRTHHTYSVACGHLEKKLGADYPMALLTTTDAMTFLHADKETSGNVPWSTRTQSSNRTIYKALWSHVIESEREAAKIAGVYPTVTENPWKNAKIQKARQSRHAFLSPDQWADLIAHSEVVDTREAAFLGIACLAGLRQQEIAHLRTTTDVDLLAGVIHVVDRKGDEEWVAKHEHSQRTVPIVPALRNLIERHMDLGFAGERYMFRVYERDEPISAMTAQDWCRRAFKAAGIRYGRNTGDGLTLHSLRHTFATWMAQRAIPFHVIAQLMGNTAAVVMKHYAHHAPGDITKAMQIIAENAAFSHHPIKKVARLRRSGTSGASQDRSSTEPTRHTEPSNNNKLAASGKRRSTNRNGKGARK